MMKTYEEFAELIKDKAAQKLGEDYQVDIIKNLKNNSIVETQLSIRKREDSAAQCIYLKSFYRTYKKDGNLEAVTEEILDHFSTDVICADTIKKLSGGMEDYSKIKDKILFKLVNTAYNQELLRQIPSIPYLDLSIVFYLYLNADSDGMMSALIYNKHLEYWDVTASDLYEAARKNTPHYLPETLMDIGQAINKSASELGQEEFQFLSSEIFDTAMYVLSNTRGINGAASILYPDVLRMCSQKLRGDFLILPSSIHETILVPYMEDCDLEFFKEMIQDANDKDVPDADILGDHAYRYDSKEDKVMAA